MTFVLTMAEEDCNPSKPAWPGERAEQRRGSLYQGQGAQGHGFAPQVW